MNRRSMMQRVFGDAFSPWAGVEAAQAKSRPIQLHCDLAVDPKREAEMLKHFETVFKPTAASTRDLSI